MLLLHDGASSGHTTWTEEAINNGVAEGLVISPFFTPARHQPRNPSGQEVSDRVRAAKGVAIFDPTTHAVSMPGVDNWTQYRSWNLWAGARGDLSTSSLIREHVERCMHHASEMSAVAVSPTIALDDPSAAGAQLAYDLAGESRLQNPNTWQALAGRRAFWLSPDLDAYVGSLAQLGAPVWLVTIVRDRFTWPPDTTEAQVMSAVLRTVHSLSLRSEVVLAHSDLIGLPAVAAGARGVGTGWHTKQRIAAPGTYQANDPDEIRRQAKWFTFEHLCALIHEQQSATLEQRDRRRAEALYPGPVAGGTAQRRLHHLGVLHELVASISASGVAQATRVASLRSRYERAIVELDDLARGYGRAFAQARAAYVDGLYEALRDYATAEGLWEG